MDNQSNYFLLEGKKYKKENKYKDAMNDFLKSFELGNFESIYEYGKMIYKGLGTTINKDAARKLVIMELLKQCLNMGKY